MTTKEAAEYLGLKIGYLYKMTSRHEIPYYSPGGKRMYFKQAELDKWIEKSRISSNEEIMTKCHSMLPLEEQKKKKEYEIQKRKEEKQQKLEEMMKDVKTYIMFDLSTGYYKIGRSKNPEYREKTLQAEKPVIEMLYVSDAFCETELHRKYKDKRVRGEWFDLSGKEIAKIVKEFKFTKV